MELYQAGYTRRGKQGEGSGWSLVCESDGMSQKAKDGFAGFAGKMAELVQTVQDTESMPTEALGMFHDERFLYYLHINYKPEMEDGDSRGVSFTHGYCFNLTDYFELCKNPDNLLGISENTFEMNYAPTIKQYPVAHSIKANRAMSLQALKEKYQISQEDYYHLLIGATCAAEGYTDALCIKLSCEKEAYMQVCTEIMYLIMQGLPYHLRIKLTFRSYKSGETKIYFSDKIAGSNYFDLDTKEYACDEKRLEKYRFKWLYTIEDDHQRQTCIAEISKFMENTFDISLKEMDCEQIEHGFNYYLEKKLKNESSKAEWKDLAMNTLTSFLRFPLKEDSKEVEEYLNILLNLLNENDLVVENEKLFKQVLNRARKSADTALRETYLTFYARQVLAEEKETAYELLWKQYKDNKGEYESLLTHIVHLVEHSNREFVIEYYEQKFMTERLKDFDGVISYLQEYQQPVRKERFQELLTNLIKKEIDAASDFAEQYKIHQKVEETDALLEKFKCENGYLECVDLLIWSKFKLESFDPDYLEEYEACLLKDVTTRRDLGIVRETVEVVTELIEKLKDELKVGTDFQLEKLYPIIFTDRNIQPETKEMILKIMKKRYLPKISPDSLEAFDFIVTCHYNLEEKKPDAPALMEFLYKKGGETFFSIRNLKSLNIREESKIINNRELLPGLAREFDEISEGNSAKNAQNKTLQKCIRIFCAYLNDEPVKEGTASETQDGGLLYGMHRIAVGALALFAISFFLVCLSQYAGISPVISVGVGVIVGIIVLLRIGIRGKQDGFKKQEIGFAVLLGLIGIILGLLFWKMPAFQKEFSTAKTTGIVILMGIYILTAIAGAILNSIEKE